MFFQLRISPRSTRLIIITRRMNVSAVELTDFCRLFRVKIEEEHFGIPIKIV